ncbi:hypothetical protein [Williamsia sp.]|uniref:hypothetical protein n=1 Tax=Williamsia sp. TaxID=1872085 RepID=UPI002F93C006
MRESAIAPSLEDFPKLTGRQLPHNLSEFDGSDIRGHKAAILANRVGIRLFPWQYDSLCAILRIDDSNRWTHPECCLIVPRQNGKSEILLLRCLYGLFVRGENIVFTTQRWTTAKSLAKRFNAMINARPSLKAKLAKKPTVSNGLAETQLVGASPGVEGPKIQFATRSNDAGRGFTVIDLLIYDEAYHVTGGMEDALDWAQMAANNPQTIYTSSAVNAQLHPNGQTLARMRRRGLAKGEGFYFAEFMAPEDLPWDALETARLANPSYGIIQTDEKILALLRKARGVPEKQKSYGVEGLGWGDWPADDNDAVTVFDKDELIIDPAPDLTGSVAISVDRSYGDRHWVIGAAQWTKEGLIHGEIGFNGVATNGTMVAKLVQIVHAWDPVVIMIDRRSPAKVLVPLLIAEGIVPEETNTSDMAVACQGIEDDITDEQMSFTDWGGLIEAITGATKRVLPQGDFAWARPEGTNIAPLVTVTLARLGLQQFGIEPAAGDVGLAEIGRPTEIDDDLWDLTDDFDAMESAF